jgi:hypothetical protein
MYSDPILIPALLTEAAPKVYPNYFKITEQFQKRSKIETNFQKYIPKIIQRKKNRKRVKKRVRKEI